MGAKATGRIILMAALPLAAAVVEAAEGTATPDELAMKLNEFGTKGNVAGFVSLVHPDDRWMIALAVWTAAELATMPEEIADRSQPNLVKLKQEHDAILAKHGVKPTTEESKSEAQMKSRMQATFKGVDIPAFCQEIGSWADRYSKKTSGSVMVLDGKLTNVKAQGDQATATLNRRAARLVRLSGRWYVRVE